jgi:hypothetical protein
MDTRVKKSPREAGTIITIGRRCGLATDIRRQSKEHLGAKATAAPPLSIVAMD